MKSQCGHIGGFCNPQVFNKEDNGRVIICELTSSTIKRVCRSTLAAEANGLLEGCESAGYLRTLLSEMNGDHDSIDSIVANESKFRTGWIIDAESLRGLIQRDAGAPNDKRLRVLIAQLREMLNEENTEVMWADTTVMLADCLTKIGPERQYLLNVLETGIWTPASTPESIRAKARLREARRTRRELQRTRQP